jgi:hypothetical protein
MDFQPAGGGNFARVGSARTMDNPMAQHSRKRRFSLAFSSLLTLLAAVPLAPAVMAQDSGGRTGNDSYQPPASQPAQPPPANDTYRPPDNGGSAYQPPYRPGGTYREDDNYQRYEGDRSAAAPRDDDRGSGYGEPYHAPNEPYYDDRGNGPPREGGGYSQSEIIQAGGRFFGSVSKGLASVVEYAFQKSGRPNGYILGTDAGGAFVAGLRYGEGTLYTKDAGAHKVYWQGPSVGYDFGGEGSKTMVLVYNLRDPSQIYERYAGVQGSAYIVGGVGIQFQTHGNVTLAPIRSGIGLRLGANIGYLKYTREPTWNPF